MFQIELGSSELLWMSICCELLLPSLILSISFQSLRYGADYRPVYLFDSEVTNGQRT